MNKEIESKKLQEACKKLGQALKNEKSAQEWADIWADFDEKHRRPEWVNGCIISNR